MLAVCIFSFFVSLACSTSLTQLLFLFSSVVVFLISSSSCYFSSIVFSSDFVSDESTILLSVLTVFVLCSSSFFCFSFSPSNFSLLSFLLLLMGLVCILFFCTSNLFVLYVIFEMSLLPIVFIIVKFGSYPDRSYSALMLFIYTSVFTLPFILVLFSVFEFSSTFFMFFYPLSPIAFNSTTALSVFTLLAFSVNLPVYGLHFWLPIAHVEAPTFGSIILAGVLLNLGGLGLARLSFFFSSSQLVWFLPLSVVLMLYSTLVCCFQSDFNRLVAYSSVSHISIIPSLVLSLSPIAFNSSLIIIFFHGLSSPLMFMLVSLVYDAYSTRQLALLSGLLTVSPLLSLFIVLGFFFTLSAPPFPSFLGEVFGFISLSSFSWLLWPILLSFAFLSLLYNLNWITSSVFVSSSKQLFSFNLKFSLFLPMFCSLFMSLISLFLFPFF